MSAATSTTPIPTLSGLLYLTSIRKDWLQPTGTNLGRRGCGDVASGIWGTQTASPYSGSGPIGKENPMGVIAWIVLGAIAGLIAEHLTGRKTGLLQAAVVGMIGALLGGFLAKTLFQVQTLDTFFNLSTWVTAIVGAVILFLLLRSGQADRRRSRRRRA